MTTEITPFEDFQNTLSKIGLSNVLPKHISEEKFKQIVTTAVRKNPKLLEYDRKSLFNACMECAQDGLIPDGRESAFVPFKGQVKYMPMVTGLTKKARNSGEIATIDAQVVYQNDEYDSWIDEKGAHFKHKKARGERGNIILTYAYAITKEGSFYFEEIDESQMQTIANCSRADDSPWKGPFKDEMRRKSALRRLCKYRLPSSSDIDPLLHRDDYMYDLEAPSNKEHVEEERTKKKTLEEVVEANVKEEEKVAQDPEPETKKQEPEEKKEEPEVIDIESDTIIGKIEELFAKEGETNGKKWTKYACKINGRLYSTFSSTVNDILKEAKEKDNPIKIQFEESNVNGKIYYNAKSAELAWEEEFTNNDIPI